MHQNGGYLRFQLRCSSIEVFGALRVTGVPQRRGRTQDQVVLRRRQFNSTHVLRSSFCVAFQFCKELT
jgi:hypothetical protein